MRRNNPTVPDPKPDRSPRGARTLKGFLSKGSKNKDSSSDSSQHRHAVDDLEITHSPVRRQNQFLPNPEIPSSPRSSSSDKKIWEGAYHNFLSGKSSSPDSVEQTKKSPKGRKSSFSVIPGTKRLVAPRNGMYGGASRGPQSMHVLDPGNGENSQEPRTGLVSLRALFNRSTSDGSVSLSRRSRNYSSGSDDLDSAMRNGMNKHSPEYSNMPQLPLRHVSLTGIAPSPHVRTSSQDDIPSGLDALLAAGSSGSPHYTVETAGMLRQASYGSTPPMMAEGIENFPSSHLYYLPKRDSTGSINHQQAGLNLDEDSFNSSTSSEARHKRSQSADCNGRHYSAQSQLLQSGGGIGSLLEEHGAARPETDFYIQRNHIQQHQNNFVYGGRNVPHQINNQRNGTLIDNVVPHVVSGLGVALQLGASNQSVTSALSNSSTYEYPYGTPPSIDPQQKKMFTVFHNQARFARDATSPFLGSEGTPSPIHNDIHIVRHSLVASSGYSLPFQGNYAELWHSICSKLMFQILIISLNTSAARSATDLRAMGGSYGTSLPPLETVDEHNISIHKSMRMLKPVTGTESWESGRRYLIAPAALAACPLTVINRLSGGLVQSAKEAVETTPSQPFGSIDLGDCLMTYVGDTHHLSLGQWSSCKLVLRQNYLLEFDASAPITGIPRGYVHLQHAQAHVHADFQNSLELDFYASPCAKADRRTVGT
jgi:hypothetical protein